MAQTLSLQQSQRMALTPELRQAISILQLSTAELTLLINEAIDQNPLLEVSDTSEEAADSFDSDQQLRWEGTASDQEPWERKEHPESLAEHLLRQVGCLSLSDKEKSLLAWLIGSLDDNGFLSAPIERLAEEAKMPAEIRLSDWKAALKLLQSFEPSGIGARDYKESLLIQLNHRRLSMQSDPVICALASQIVQEHLELLAKRSFDKIRPLLGCASKELEEAVRLIAALTPHPASEFSTDSINYVTPEILVRKTGEGWCAELIDASLPKVRLNRIYAEAVTDSCHDQLWKDRLHEASELIKNIEHRRITLLRVTQALVRRQSDFFESGPLCMRPLVLRQIADELELHESTVSRVVSGKYLQCARGVFELKYFFSSQIGNSNEAVSSIAVKNEIARLIASENPSKPLSDAKITEFLSERGFSAARRTVAKYRDALGIAPASQRKKIR